MRAVPPLFLGKRLEDAGAPWLSCGHNAGAKNQSGNRLGGRDGVRNAQASLSHGTQSPLSSVGLVAIPLRGLARVGAHPTARAGVWVPPGGDRQQGGSDRGWVLWVFQARRHPREAVGP